MSKNHFLPFQINIIICIFVIVFTKWLPAAILDVRNSVSIAFLAILDQYGFIYLFYLQNGSRRTFWMFENYFRLHFWPFQIDQPFWMSEINFRWHFWPFQTHTDLNFVLNL